ncbi:MULTISPECIES: hypothetical protein [unclassified Tenacibaculum]|uniref:hypothetical protein n=1 Tax=unclassified Tenacibaculum TaxID=2635139 RepID=UPI001F3645CB|nr:MULTISPECIES: hypothetical protein [unclassified Tenacibaculum]MCF2873811.1 hypothetical protein [Tenacibaculum sp. Cn5-1]MCF2933967.1 hypothetical protein [Tenacibaculum sp. Cn5-34]MCG7509451.1 hypothetical protein [Tenacibaculum sp. Cn5-46]
MNETESCLNEITTKYPKKWEDLDKSIKRIIPHKQDSPFDPYESKYYKEFILSNRNDQVEYIPTEQLSESFIKAHNSLIDNSGIYMIDFQNLLNDYDESYFDLESWSNDRKEVILNSINNYLFDCNIFKGIFFFSQLSEAFREIDKSLHNLDNIKYFGANKPSWLQTKIKEILELEVKSIKDTLIFNYKPIYSKLDQVLYKTKASSEFYKFSDNDWFKIAKAIAEGYIDFEASHYIIDKERIYIEAEASRLVSNYIYGSEFKKQSVNAYLNQTKSNTPTNKNIFIPSRIKALEFIAEEAKNNGFESDYFKEKLKKLKKDKER